MQKRETMTTPYRENTALNKPRLTEAKAMCRKNMQACAAQQSAGAAYFGEKIEAIDFQEIEQQLEDRGNAVVYCHNLIYKIEGTRATRRFETLREFAFLKGFSLALEGFFRLHGYQTKLDESSWRLEISYSTTIDDNY